MKRLPQVGVRPLMRFGLLWPKLAKSTRRAAAHTSIDSAGRLRKTVSTRSKGDGGSEADLGVVPAGD
jgi:hypothetical protein